MSTAGCEVKFGGCVGCKVTSGIGRSPLRSKIIVQLDRNPDVSSHELLDGKASRRFVEEISKRACVHLGGIARTSYLGMRRVSGQGNVNTDQVALNLTIRTECTGL